MKHLTKEQRYEIQVLNRLKVSKRKIAEEVVMLDSTFYQNSFILPKIFVILQAENDEDEGIEIV